MADALKRFEEASCVFTPSPTILADAGALLGAGSDFILLSGREVSGIRKSSRSMAAVCSVQISIVLLVTRMHDDEKNEGTLSQRGELGIRHIN